MPQVECRSCRYTRHMTKRELEFGMRCPECHAGNLKPIPKKGSRKDRVTAVQPATIRALISGVCLILLGGLLLAYGRSNWNAGRFGARMVGAAVVLLVMGVISLIAGFVGWVRDLR